VTSLFAAFDIADGTVNLQTYRRRRAVEFKKVPGSRSTRAVPEEWTSTWCATPVTHKTPASNDWLPDTRVSTCTSPRPIELVESVERWFGFLTDQLCGVGPQKCSGVGKRRPVSGPGVGMRDPSRSCWRQDRRGDPGLSRSVYARNFERRTLVPALWRSIVSHQRLHVVAEGRHWLWPHQ